jgi:hypothetical protein
MPNTAQPIQPGTGLQQPVASGAVMPVPTTICWSAYTAALVATAIFVPMIALIATTEGGSREYAGIAAGIGWWAVRVSAIRRVLTWFTF